MLSKDNITTTIIIIILLSIVFFSPQISGFLSITGRATSEETDLNITIGNQNPTIPIENISVIADQSITLNTFTQINISFLACDPDGYTDISGVYANFTGEQNVSGGNNFYDANLTCRGNDWTNATCSRYNCSFNFWYWYKSGSWNFSMNVTDGTATAHENGSTFQLGSTTGMVISPNNISWSNLNLDTWNNTADDDPILINNTGNYNVSLSSVNLTAQDLIGEDEITEYIPAANFTVNIITSGDTNPNVECHNDTIEGGTQMFNDTSQDVLYSVLPRGNHSANIGTAGQEQLYLCLRHVPPVAMVSQQSYSTRYSQWLVGVS